jgi:2',3'-cyclic-nucleotide 2'-phosphodiesterase (5'-nucleotidase family)
MSHFSRRDALKIAAGAAALAISAPAWAQTAPKITFVVTNDIYKMSEEKGRGGMARLAAVVRAERARNPNTLFTHAGDTFSPSLMSGFDQGAHMVELFNAMKLDAFVPGNHEFDFGKEVFAKRVGEAKFPVYGANMRQADGSPVPGVKDSAIFELAGIKVGVYGIALQMTPALSSPGDLKFGQELETAREQNRALRQAGAEFVVALVHTDRTTDFRLAEARLADLILTGHDHDLRVVYDGKTAMVESGEDGQYVTVVDVAFDVKTVEGKRQVAWWPDFRVVDSATVTPDPELLAKVKGYEADLSRELDVAVATLSVELDSRSATVRSQEAAIGNLIADALRHATGADIAITNGGGIRGNRQYNAGHSLTRRDVLTELPFGNRTAVSEVSGAAIKAALESGVSQYENRAGRFPQVSGLTLEVDPKAPVGSRVSNIKVNGAPLEDAKIYKVATNDFMMRGGDGYGALAGKIAATVDSGGSLMASDVMAYARKLGTIQARPEGRILIK